MTGICGIVAKQSIADLSVRVAAMSDSLRHFPWHTVEQSTADQTNYGLGRVSLGFVNTAPQPVTIGDASAVMDGELYNAAICRRNLEQAGAVFVGESHAEIVLRGFLAEGRDFFSRLNGKFSAGIFDGRANCLLLVNDRFGMKPLYYTDPIDGEFQFASEIKALLTNPAVSRKQSQRGVAQFFTFGHLWGEETLYESIQALPPAACVEFDSQENRISIDRYWKPTQVSVGDISRTDLLEQIDGAFKKSIDQQTLNTPNLGLALSGGMDARTILASLDHESVAVKSLCMGMPGSRDQRSAREMARLAGCEYHDFMLDGEFLSNFQTHLHRMVHLTDGHYLSQCIVLPTFPKYRELGIEVLLRGHAGELMHMQKAYNFSVDREALQIDSAAKLQDWSYNRLRAYMLDSLDQPLFAFADTTETDDIARETIQASLADSAEWERPLDRIWQLFLTERLRRETAMSLVKFGSVVETRLPYLSPELISLLLSAPAEMKLDEEIQSYILQKRFPDFLGVTNVNTGARVGAGSFVRNFQSFKMRVFAKLGMPGYQPYERLGLWLRRELKPLVRELLLDDRCLSRGTFRPDTIRQVVDQHQTGSRNHTFLLMALMIYELGQRKFADDETLEPSGPEMIEQHA